MSGSTEKMESLSGAFWSGLRMGASSGLVRVGAVGGIVESVAGSLTGREGSPVAGGAGFSGSGVIASGCAVSGAVPGSGEGFSCA